MLILVFKEVRYLWGWMSAYLLSALGLTVYPSVNSVYLMDGGNVIPKLVTRLGEKTIPYLSQRKGISGA